MKITASLPEDLVKEIKKLARGKNLDDSLEIALREWSTIQKLKVLRERVRRHPLSFRKGFTAKAVRELNRKP